MKKTFKNQGKGITLIALVVTIVVLLILATVSIQMLGGENGIIKQAQEAKDKTKEEGAKEQIGVEVAGSYGTDGKINIPLLNENLGHIEGITYKGASLSETNKIETLPATVELDGVKVVINGDGSTNKVPYYAGKKYDEETDITVDGTQVTVPGGAVISEIPGEYENIEKGIVIYIMKDADEDGTIDSPDWSNPDKMQKTYDQFVWVPVPNAVLDLSSTFSTLDTTGIKAAVQSEINAGRYPMAIKKDATNYLGVLYQFTEENGAVKVEPYTGWYPLSKSGRNEPTFLTDYDGGNAIYNKSSLQQEFNTMVNRVSSNKGFWVGRYETSNMVSDDTKDSTNKVTVIKGTTTGINKVNWYRMCAQQKSYSKLALGDTTTATSSMIWGSQWDQIMIWMRTVKNTINTTNGQYYITNAVGMGNYGVDETGAEKITKAVEKTGNSEKYKVKNIYDLAGNVREWNFVALVPSERESRRVILPCGC